MIEAFSPPERPSLTEELARSTEFGRGWKPYRARRNIQPGDIVEYLDTDGQRIEFLHVVTPPHECDNLDIEGQFRAHYFDQAAKQWSGDVVRRDPARILRVLGQWDHHGKLSWEEALAAQQNDQSCTAPVTLPRAIHIGKKLAAATKSFATPAEVTSAEHLPLRFFLGDLDKNSFGQTAKGWHVLYRDADPQIYCELAFETHADRLTVRQHYYGHDEMFIGNGKSFEAALQSYSVFPDGWREILKKRAMGIGTVLLPSLPNEIPITSGFPDGAFFSVFVPLPIHRLAVGVELLADIQAEAAVATGVTIDALLGESRVTYFEDDGVALGREPENDVFGPCGSEFLTLRLIEDTGFPPLAIENNGTRWVKLHRQHYTLRIECLFRDLHRVLETLQRKGLIGGSSDCYRRGRYPHGLEFAALVVPTGAERELNKLAFTDAERSRHFSYPPASLVKPDAVVECDVSDLIRLAEEAADRLCQKYLDTFAAGRVRGKQSFDPLE